MLFAGRAKGLVLFALFCAKTPKFAPYFGNFYPFLQKKWSENAKYLHKNLHVTKILYNFAVQKLNNNQANKLKHLKSYYYDKGN